MRSEHEDVLIQRLIEAGKTFTCELQKLRSTPSDIYIENARKEYMLTVHLSLTAYLHAEKKEKDNVPILGRRLLEAARLEGENNEIRKNGS